MTHAADQQLLLAALRDPSLAPSMFALSLPCVAAERATLAFETMVETLARYARRPWRCGSDGSPWTAGEASVLRLLGASAANARGSAA